MSAWTRRRDPGVAALTVVAIATAMAADAGAQAPQQADATWKAECGRCHVAYPPRFLPARSWRAVMQGLERHFGANARVDARTAASIGAYLEADAESDGDGATEPPVLRITETRWFQHEHQRVPAAVWRNPAVRSASNCTACHRDADDGDFSGRAARIPR